MNSIPKNSSVKVLNSFRNYKYYYTIDFKAFCKSLNPHVRREIMTVIVNFAKKFDY